eukprot:scaffold80668_cov79-Cyclotella_meneghiniana.AAC.7
MNQGILLSIFKPYQNSICSPNLDRRLVEIRAKYRYAWKASLEEGWLQPFFSAFQPWQSYQIFPNNKVLWTSTLSLRQAFKKNDSDLERHRKA